MTTEERNAKMEAAGIQAGSPAAKRFIADNETNEEAIERCAEELKASGQKVVPSRKSQSKPPIEQKTLTTSDNERLLIESIKQTEHLKSISNNVKFYFYLTVFSALLYFLIVYFS